MPANSLAETQHANSHKRLKPGKRCPRCFLSLKPTNRLNGNE